MNSLHVAVVSKQQLEPQSLSFTLYDHQIKTLHLQRKAASASGCRLLFLQSNSLIAKADQKVSKLQLNRMEKYTGR